MVDEVDSNQPILRIVRLEQSEDGAFGVLLFKEKLFCMTLQPDKEDLHRFHIPPGLYSLRHFNGIKYKGTLEILVSGHTALIFHSGNWERNTLGCTLLGSEARKLGGNRAVLNSGATFERFKQKIVPQVSDGDLILIEDCY